VQIAQAEAAISDAQDMALAATAAVADTPDHARWFGPWDEARAGTVRSTYRAIAAALASDDLHVRCPPVQRDACLPTYFAYVLPEEALAINLCAPFFAMPGVAGVVAGSIVFETGTREGTILHEVSHLAAVAGTADHCYGRTDCAVMARREPWLAVGNADSLQYFAEDVALGLRSE
jgi:peptidyl-Lys metalloendopeptidase